MHSSFLRYGLALGQIPSNFEGDNEKYNAQLVIKNDDWLPSDKLKKHVPGELAGLTYSYVQREPLIREAIGRSTALKSDLSILHI